MAVRARLTPPREEQTAWPWHKAKTGSLPASLLFSGDRRMEAENFLATGFATKIAIEQRKNGWSKLSEVAETWQPSRLKGIQVSPDYGTPFLAATQVYDIRPSPRKWLSLERTDDYKKRFIHPRTILLTCSGNVGRATLALKNIEGVLISHDLLRIEPVTGDNWGWTYAYLRAPKVIEMLRSAQYGHIIKHLEVSHVDNVPIIDVDCEVSQAFNNDVERIFGSRNKANELSEKAEGILDDYFEVSKWSHNSGTPYTAQRASKIFTGRRRLEANYHSPEARTVLENMTSRALDVVALSDVSQRVWWMTRFSRYFGEGGVPYMSADELFSISQISEKRIYTDPVPNHRDFFVEEGWILMACSGQIYGLNGSVTLATKIDEQFFFSHDLTGCGKRRVRVG